MSATTFLATATFLALTITCDSNETFALEAPTTWATDASIAGSHSAATHFGYTAEIVLLVNTRVRKLASKTSYR